MTKTASQLQAGDSVNLETYGPVMVNEVVSTRAVVGFYYDDPSVPGGQLYGWLNPDELVV